MARHPSPSKATKLDTIKNLYIEVRSGPVIRSLTPIPRAKGLHLSTVPPVTSKT